MVSVRSDKTFKFSDEIQSFSTEIVVANTLNLNTEYGMLEM
jgi:hypothetical protein